MRSWVRQGSPADGPGAVSGDPCTRLMPEGGLRGSADRAGEKVATHGQACVRQRLPRPECHRTATGPLDMDRGTLRAACL